MSAALAGVRAALQPRWVSDRLWRRAQQMPAFDIDFERGTIIDRIRGVTPTFTRPSSVKLAWDGAQFVEFAADVPAFQRDPVTGRLGYLHEPAATNLFLNSTAPATQNITVTAQQYTLSFYGTGTITRSGVSSGALVGTGPVPSRASVTFTPSAGTLTLTVSGSVERPQLETGAVATSPIDTGAGTVTRSGDTMTVDGVDFSTIYNELGGLVYWEGMSSPSDTVNEHFFAISDNTSNNRVAAFQNAGSIRSRIVTAGAFSSPSGFVLAEGALARYAMRFSAGLGQACLNGTLSSTVAPVSLPVVDRLYIGANHSNTAGEALNGLIIRIAYFPPGPAQSRLQQMTAA